MNLRTQRFPWIESSPRRGIALLIAVIALAIVTMICATATRTTVLMHSHTLDRLDRHQAELLALAGLERFRQNPEFRISPPGNWTVELRSGETAVVETQVESSQASIIVTSRATVTSRAGLPITISRQLSLPVAVAERL